MAGGRCGLPHRGARKARSDPTSTRRRSRVSAVAAALSLQRRRVAAESGNTASSPPRRRHGCPRDGPGRIAGRLRAAAAFVARRADAAGIGTDERPIPAVVSSRVPNGWRPRAVGEVLRLDVGGRPLTFRSSASSTASRASLADRPSSSRPRPRSSRPTGRPITPDDPVRARPIGTTRLRAAIEQRSSVRASHRATSGSRRSLTRRSSPPWCGLRRRPGRRGGVRRTRRGRGRPPRAPIVDRARWRTCGRSA